MLKEQLEQFIQITHCKTVEEASERMGIPEAQVGALIATLEEKIGHPLFNKRSSSLDLTGYGRVLRERSPHIILELRHLDEGLEEESKRKALSIHFGFSATTHCFVLMPQIAAALSDLLFTVSVQASRNLISDMEKGNIDIAIMPANEAPEGYETWPLVVEQAYLSVPFTSSLVDKDKLELSDVAKEPIYMVSDLYGLSQWYDSIYTAAGGDPSRAQRPDAGEYLSGAKDTPRNHFDSNVMQLFGNVNAQRVEIPIDDDIARRQMVMVYKGAEKERLKPIIDFVTENTDTLYSSHAFLPYLMHPTGELENLMYLDVKNS